MYIESERWSLSDQDTSMPKGIPLPEHELMRRRHEIFGASVQLFLTQGFQETGMREIAERADICDPERYPSVVKLGDPRQ